jgi:hypothetical protein
MVCDLCVEAIEEDSAGFGLSRREIVQIAIEHGYMLPDHRCDRIESNGEIPCECTAHEN